jgi:hypothetical protein
MPGATSYLQSDAFLLLHHLAFENSRSGTCVRLTPSVQVVQNPRIILLIRTRERNRRRRLTRLPTRNINLRTLHIKLRAHARTGRMQRNQFTPQQILSRSNALGNRNRLHALVRNQPVNAPFRAVKGVLADLEPASADTGIGLCVADFLHVGHDGSLVA